MFWLPYLWWRNLNLCQKFTSKLEINPEFKSVHSLRTACVSCQRRWHSKYCPFDSVAMFYVRGYCMTSRRWYKSFMHSYYYTWKDFKSWIITLPAFSAQHFCLFIVHAFHLPESFGFRLCETPWCVCVC